MKINLILSAKKDPTGKSQIVLEMVHGKLRARAKSGVFVLPQFFSGGALKEIRANRIVSPMVRAELDDARRRLNDIVDEVTDKFNDADKSSIGKDWLKDVVEVYLHPLRAHAATKASFFELSEVYLGDPNKNFSEDHIRGCRVLFRVVARYESFVRQTSLGERKNFKFDYDTLTSDDLEDFRDYLRNEKSLSEQCPVLFEKLFSTYPSGVTTFRRKSKVFDRGENAVVKLMKKLKGYFAWLTEKGYTKNHPFDGVKIGSEKYGEPYYITIEERNRIACAELPTEHLRVQRDIFVFQCLVGCRVGDLLRFTPDNIVGGVLEYTPHKTKDELTVSRKARVPLIPAALSLVERYNGVSSDGRLFPFISSQKYNDAIKKIFTLAGVTRIVEVRNATTGEMEHRPINEIASSHLARRTFVGNLYFKVQDPSLIGAMSGHVDGSRAFSRYRKIEDETLRDVVGLLE